MFFLFDCDNFFVSCERLFRPDLKSRPVIVLSSNDGCVVSRSYEAKAIPIAMGAPYFKIEKVFRAAGGTALSSNFELYSDISRRLMSLLRQECGGIRIYSVDEAFASLPDDTDHFRFALHIRNRILKEIGIPVSIGIAPTKTLCKIASSLAKSKTFDKIEILTPGQSLQTVLKNFEVKDVWGVGRRIAPKLNFLGIFTALELSSAPLKMIRQTFGINLEKTAMELNGIPCQDATTEETARSITVSRSFEREISNIGQLEAIIAGFTDTACRRLRAQNAAAREIAVFLKTNRFKNPVGQSGGSYLIPLGGPCIHTGHFITAAKFGLRQIFTPGEAYKSAGVTLQAIEEISSLQSSLFEKSILPPKEQKLMQVFDNVNNRLGAHTVFFAAQTVSPQNFTRGSFRSPAYTTSWDALPVVH